MEYDEQNHQFIFNDDDREVLGLGIDRHTWEADRPAPLYTLVMATQNKLLRRLERGEVNIEQIADELLVRRQFKVVTEAIKLLSPHLPEVEVIMAHEREL
jgi:hypothetical protein